MEKRIFWAIFPVVILLVVSCGSRTVKVAQETDVINPDTGKAVLVFTEYEHSFGKVSEGEKIGYVFNLENKGTSDLVILAAITSCGCTVPKYDSKPIAPGKKGRIEVIFDTSGRNGMQAKTITIRSNASVPVVVLKITAEIEADKR